MKTLRFIFLFALVAMSVRADAKVLGGDGVVITPNSGSPFSGTQAGIWNHAGVLEYRIAAGSTAPVLQCPSCTVGLGQIPKVSDLATLTPSGMAVAGVGPLLQLTITNGDIIINGNPANGGGLTFPDGTKLTTAAGSSVGWSFVDQCVSCGINGAGCPNGQSTNKMFQGASANGNFTTGDLYTFTSNSTVTGIRTYWANTTAGKTLKMCMWDAQTQASMQCANATTTGATGLYSVVFGASQAATAYHMYSFSVYETTGAFYAVCEPTAGLITGGTSALMNQAGKNNTYVWDVSDFSPNDTFPGQRSSAEHHAVEPVFTTP